MAAGDPTWQEILDALTRKAVKQGLVRSVKNAKTFEAKVDKVIDSIGIRNKLSSYISQCAESKFAKSGGTASKLRDEGNAKFKIHDNEGAIRFYTESIICSPEYGPELSLGYGNRSAALYYVGQYDFCLKDIEMALKYRYPKNLEYKLHQRRGLCLTKLAKYSEARNAFQSAVTALESVPKLPAEKKESIKRDINALMAETDSSSKQRSLSQESAEPVVQAPTEPKYGTNETFPGASSILEIKESTIKGRHVIANKNVKVGDVLFSEIPYASILLPEHYSSHCHHCVS